MIKNILDSVSLVTEEPVRTRSKILFASSTQTDNISLESESQSQEGKDEFRISHRLLKKTLIDDTNPSQEIGLLSTLEELPQSDFDSALLQDTDNSLEDQDSTQPIFKQQENG